MCYHKYCDYFTVKSCFCVDKSVENPVYKVVIHRDFVP